MLLETLRLFERLRAQLEADLAAAPEQIVTHLDTDPLAGGIWGLWSIWRGK